MAETRAGKSSSEDDSSVFTSISQIDTISKPLAQEEPFVDIESFKNVIGITSKFECIIIIKHL